jgi:hypothetical protein
LGDARPIPSFEGSPARALEIVAVAGLGLNLSPLPNRTTSAFNFRRHQTLIAYRRPDEPRRKGVISRSSVNLFMCTGGAYRPFLHDRHFNAARPKPLTAKPASRVARRVRIFQQFRWFVIGSLQRREPRVDVFASLIVGVYSYRFCGRPSRWPLMAVRSSSVNFAHFSLTIPLTSIQFLSTLFRSMAEFSGCGNLATPQVRSGPSGRLIPSQVAHPVTGCCGPMVAFLEPSRSFNGTKCQLTELPS